MVKIVKYTNELGADAGAECDQKLPGCKQAATRHVCFEDGSGTYSCEECFTRRANEGDWITDNAQVLPAP